MIRVVTAAVFTAGKLALQLTALDGKHAQLAHLLQAVGNSIHMLLLLLLTKQPCTAAAAVHSMPTSCFYWLQRVSSCNQ
jgi:hypothetical protein